MKADGQVYSYNKPPHGHFSKTKKTFAQLPLIPLQTQAMLEFRYGNLIKPCLTELHTWMANRLEGPAPIKLRYTPPAVFGCVLKISVTLLRLDCLSVFGLCFVVADRPQTHEGSLALSLAFNPEHHTGQDGRGHPTSVRTDIMPRFTTHPVPLL